MIIRQLISAARNGIAGAAVLLVCSALSACGGIAKDALNALGVPGINSKYTVGGTVSGLAGTGLVIQDNGGDNLAISGNGSFTFATSLALGANYSVTVMTQPSGPSQTCTVAGGTGVMGSANATSVAITCTTNTFTVGGTVSGLNGGGLILEDNGADDLAVSANGPFTFATALADSTAYAVTVKTQPTNAAQSCTISSGTGTIASANVTTVTVSCANTSAGPITPQQKQAVLATVAAQYTVIHMQGGDFSAAMAQYLMTRPEFTEVGIATDKSIYAEFNDGTELIVAVDGPPSGHPTPAAAGALVRRVIDDANPVTQPAKNNAYITQEFGAGYDVAEALTTDVNQWLNTAGYNSIDIQGADTDYLRKNIKNASVFMMTSHGGTGKSGVYAVWTTTGYTGATADDEADVASGRMRYMTAPVDTIPYNPPACTEAEGCPIGDTHYAITAQFVSAYMSFGTGSFVLINACNSAASDAKASSDGTAFAEAFGAKGATNYVGWQGTANDAGANPVRYVFDRLLGEIPGNNTRNISQESPPQRAFDIGPVLSDMTAQGLIPLHDTDKSGKLQADGNLVALGAGNAILAPSIAFLVADEYDDLLDVIGIFDPNTPIPAAQVSVAGKDCPVKTLTANTIACSLPRSGAGSEGDVIVTLDGIQSNAVALTSWRGSFSYQITGEASIQATAALNLHWRADIHNWRTAPHTTPQHYDFLVDTAQDSTASWSASGTETCCGSPPATLNVSGGGNLPWAGSSPAVAAQFFSMFIVIDPALRTLWGYPTALAQKQLILGGNACPSPNDFALIMADALNNQAVTFYTTPPPYGTAQISAPAFPMLLAQDTTYTLSAGKLSGNYASGCPYGIRGDNQPWMLTWPDIQPTNVPDPTAAQ